MKFALYKSLVFLLQWLENDFLGYLKEWEDSVKADTGSSDGEKPKMLLSRQTIEGLVMSGMGTYIQVVNLLRRTDVARGLRWPLERVLCDRIFDLGHA